MILMLTNMNNEDIFVNMDTVAYWEYSDDASETDESTHIQFVDGNFRVVKNRPYDIVDRMSKMIIAGDRI